MRRVLIAGCGYIGTAAAEIFLRADWNVEGWTRSGSLPADATAEFPVRAVDLTDADAVARTDGEFDVIIHCASTRGGDVADYARVYRGGVENLLRRFPQGQLIFVSSTSVYAQRSGEWVDETSAAEPVHERGIILRTTEELVLSRAGQVGRLAGIYGPGRSALLRRVLENKAAVDDGADRFVNQVHRDDAASALVRIAELRARSGIWNVADNEPLLLSDCYRWLSQRLDRPLAGSASPIPRKRGDSNKRVRNARLRSDGWAPKFSSFKEGMANSVLASI